MKQKASTINQSLQPLAVPIAGLTPDPDNARDHNERNRESIRVSLEKFGQQKPIVVNSDGVVIAGNGTLAAATELGWSHIAAVVYDGEGLPDAFAIADNRSAELAEWNFEHLTVNLKSLRERGFDIEKLGWKDYELEPLFKANWAPSGGAEEKFQGATAKGAPIKLTQEQRGVVNQAIARIRSASDTDATMTEGRAIELICADYIAGFSVDEGDVGEWEPDDDLEAEK